jgi:hypothetical protein
LKFFEKSGWRQYFRAGGSFSGLATFFRVSLVLQALASQHGRPLKEFLYFVMQVYLFRGFPLNKFKLNMKGNLSCRNSLFLCKFYTHHTLRYNSVIDSFPLRATGGTILKIINDFSLFRFELKSRDLKPSKRFARARDQEHIGHFCIVHGRVWVISVFPTAKATASSSSSSLWALFSFGYVELYI